MPDIFDQVAGGTAPKGDIFDQVAPTKKPSPFRDVIEKAFNALYGMNLGQGEEALYGTPTGRAPSAPGKMGFFEKNVIPESPPVPLSEREMYLSPTPGAPPRPQESIRSGEPTPAMDTLKAHGKNILSAADQVHAHTMDLMAGLGKIIEEAVPGYSGTWLKQKYQELARKDRELAEEFKTDPQGAADKLTKTVLQGVVSLGDPTLPLMANPAAFGAVSAIAAYGQGRPVDQSIIDGLKSGIVAKGFGKVHGLKPTEAAGKMGAIGATEAATGTPGGIEEKALAGLEGGVTQGIFGGMAASRLGPKGREAYKTNAPIVGHEKALEIARTVEAQKSPKGDIFDRVAGVSTELRTEKPTIKYTEGGDALGKEYHGYITAIDEATGKPAGRVDYSYWNGETAVKMIEVDPEYRRMGIATDLLKKLQADSKEPIKIQGNFATEEGQALWKKFAPEMPQAETGKATMPPAPEKPQGGEIVKAGEVENTVRGDIIPPVTSKQGPGEKTTEATPIRVQRIEEPGAETSFDKPQGLYTTPEGVDSPHTDLGGIKVSYEIKPEAKILDIPEYDTDIAMRKGAVSAGAGVHAARHLLGDDQFKILKGKPRRELIAWASKRYPFADFSKYYDAQEVMEAIGGLEARKAGYDVFRVEDKKQPEFSEIVILNKDIAREINQSRPSEKGGKPVPPEVLKDYPELARKAQSAIMEPVTSKQGPGEKTTEATPKPEGGIILDKNDKPLVVYHGQSSTIIIPEQAKNEATDIRNKAYEIENILRSKYGKDENGYRVHLWNQDPLYATMNDLYNKAALIEKDASFYKAGLDNNAFDPERSKDIGIHFTVDPDVAGRIGKTGTVFPVYLQADKLIRVKDIFSRYQGLEDALYELADKGIITNKEANSLNKKAKKLDALNYEDERDWGQSDGVRAFWKELNAIMSKKKGLALVYENEVEGGGDSYVVFHNDQIKSIYDLPNLTRPPEKGGKTALSDIGESPKGIPARKTPPIITTEQKKRQAKAKAVKEQQLKVESAEDAKKAVHSMIRERRYRLNLATYESNLFINEIERSTSREQREVIPFIIENTDVPKGLNRPDLEKIHAAEKANLAPIARQVKDHFDKGWQKMKESTPDMSAEQIEDYVTHIWDIPKGKKREVTSWFTTQNRFLKKRFIETINEGVEKFGLQPKTLDISEIIRIHDSVMNRVIENNRFVEDLKKLRKDGVPLIERADKAPQDWAYFDHPALRRGLIIPGEAKMGEKVSPELADILAEMGVAIGRRISPVTFGKPTWKAGEYRPGDTPEVRFQRFMSNRTIAHEIGHHLDATLGLGDKFLNKYKTELYEVNRKRIESFAGTDKEAYAKSTEEQIAEFFAILFTNPDLASKVAPTATADALTRLKGDGIMTKLAGFDFEKNAKNLIEERLDTMVKLPVKVHPDLEAPLKVIFESRMTHPAIQAYETMNGILKKTELSLSLFHHVALGETGIGTMGLPKTLGIYFNPVKIFKAMWRGEYDIYKKEPIARDAIEHGLQVGATSDIPVNMIQTKLNDMARKTRNVLVINKATAFLRTFNEQWDKALWNYLHDTLKLQGYESLCAKMDPTKDIKAQKEEIAQFVNDTFGGQNWDVLMVSPKSLQLMSWFLLSPDWTLSTLRQALAPTGIGTIHKEAGSALRKKMGAHFWIKAGLYFGLGINMLNYMNRKRDEKEHPEYYEGEERGFFDRTMAGNAIGHKTHLFAGRYDDGTERYVRWGKQFRELPEMFFDDTGFSPISATIKKIGGKMAPALQLASSILTGSSLSGFRNDDINGKEGWDKVYGIAKTILKSPFPFSSRTMFDENKEFHATDLAMPSSKGMTRYRSMELFKVAVAKGDERMLKEVYQDTLRNNLPAYTLFNASLAQLKAESTKEYNEGLKSIADIQERAKQVETPLEAARLARIMKRMIKENADRMAGMKLLDAAILNLRKYQILNEAEAGSKK